MTAVHPDQRAEPAIPAEVLARLRVRRQLRFMQWAALVIAVVLALAGALVGFLTR